LISGFLPEWNNSPFTIHYRTSDYMPEPLSDSCFSDAMGTFFVVDNFFYGKTTGTEGTFSIGTFLRGLPGVSSLSPLVKIFTGSLSVWRKCGRHKLPFFFLFDSGLRFSGKDNAKEIYVNVLLLNFLDDNLKGAIPRGS